jgi:hypothetical protein
MGDLTSSLFSLGYHEKINNSTFTIPAFIIELRRASFARIYSGDKNLAVFLGRPPRICKRYCDFNLPACVMSSGSEPQGTPDQNTVQRNALTQA